MSNQKEKKPDNTVQLFEQYKVRTIWDEDLGKWWFSVVDVVAVLTDSVDANSYWRKLKQRLAEEGNETVTICHTFKMKAIDGKMRSTNVADTEQILRLIQSIPSKKAEPFKMWLAKVGNEYIDEATDPELAIDRAVKNYRNLGYSESWINQRIKTIEARKSLTDEWDKSGVKQGKEYAFLTDLMYKTWADMNTKEYKKLKGLKKESLRDNMTNTELVLNMLAEVASTDISIEEQPMNFCESFDIAKRGAGVAKDARKSLESQTKKSAISPLNAKSLGNKTEELAK
jgi:hypothetical protein